MEVVAGKTEEEAEKIVVKDEDDILQIVVRDQSGEEVFFKVKPKTLMGKLFESYAQRRGVERAVLRFMLDGKRILNDDTPESLKLEDRDQVDCLLEQIGGWW